MQQDIPKADDVYKTLCNVAVNLPKFADIAGAVKAESVPSHQTLSNVFAVASIALQSLIVEELLKTIEEYDPVVLRVPPFDKPSDAVSFIGANKSAFSHPKRPRAMILVAPTLVNDPVIDTLATIYQAEVYSTADVRLSGKALVIPMPEQQTNVIRVNVRSNGDWVKGICGTIPRRYTPTRWLQELVRNMEWPKPLEPIQRNVMPPPSEIYGVHISIFSVPTILDFSDALLRGAWASSYKRS